MNEQSIAAQLYTVREYLKTPEEIRTSLRKVKELGYEAVQASGLGPIEADELREILGSFGLTMCATHIGWDRLSDHLDEVIADHKLWNCEYVGLGSMPKNYQAGLDGYREFVKVFSEIGRRLSDSGLHLVYHNHCFEFERFDGTVGMDVLLDGAGPQTYTLELDTYWVQAGGANPVEWIAKASGRLKVIHLKDMAVNGWTPVFAEVGQGNFNWPAIIDACRQSGVEWYVVEQDTCQRDPFESLGMSRHHLQSLL